MKRFCALAIRKSGVYGMPRGVIRDAMFRNSHYNIDFPGPWI
jgi:hypothetical protein